MQARGKDGVEGKALVRPAGKQLDQSAAAQQMPAADLDDLRDAEAVRPYFRRLRELRDESVQRHPNLRLDTLSMGMTHDYSVAIEEGATEIRLGTALFGARDYGKA